MAGEDVKEPFPIYLVCGRYLLYDVNVVSHVRAIHHMCGCLSGTLPQIPQQNVFLGLPLELMTEEAALLVEKGAGYVVDDVKAHVTGLKAMLPSEKAEFLEKREEECRREAEAHQRAAEERKIAFTSGKQSIPETETPSSNNNNDNDDDETPLNPHPNPTSEPAPPPPPEPPLRHYPTPTTSHPLYHLLPPPSTSSPPHIPKPPPHSYPLYKHLHSKNYFLSPGLRFGCHYMAYPGDPLRFHSHFVATGLEWDEEIEIRDVVGGGRLGTGVKKAWMVGGEEPGEEPGEGRVRCFCVEWGGF